MMKNIFVTYEIAKKLKDLGFNEPCIGWFSEMGLLKIYDYQISVSSYTKAPLWQQAEEWLFKQYNIFIEIKRLKVMADPEDDLYVYYCEIGDFSSEHYKMPKQALKKGIEEALKLIKDK